MDELLAQEELRFEPNKGSFDVGQVAARIETLGFSFRDKLEPAVFVVCLDEASRAHARERREQAPERGFPYVLLIRVEPEQIDVVLFAGPEFGPLAAEFIGWLVAKYDCRVQNESGRDLTDKLAAVASK